MGWQMMNHGILRRAIAIVIFTPAGVMAQGQPPPGVPPFSPPPFPPSPSRQPQPPQPPPGIPGPDGFVPPVPRPPEDELVKELEQMLARGQYQTLIQRVNKRLSASKSQPIYDFDRARMLLLKGEAHLQLRAASLAIAAFEEVEPIGTETHRARATATAALVKRSADFAYRPKSAGTRPEGIDILKDRAAALDALRVDELADVSAKVKAAPAPRTLAQVMQVIDLTDTLRALETATGATSAESASLLRDVREQARGLMEQSLVGFDTQITDIRERANRTTPAVGRDMMIYDVKQGLRPSFKRTLESIKQHCGDVMRAAEALGPKAPAESPFAATVARATEIAKAADETLHADYRSWIPTGKKVR